MNSKKLNKLTKKYIESVTKDFDEPIKIKNSDKNPSQNGGSIDIFSENNDINDNNNINIISIQDIMKLKKK